MTDTTQATAPAPRIVLIEDQTILRQVLRMVLKTERGWTDITEFSNGIDGLAHCLASPPDLLIVDLNLPGKGGWEIAKELRPQAAGTRILVLSANTDEIPPADFMSIGVNGFVNKDAPYDHLLQAITVVMSGALFFSAQPISKPKPAGGPTAAVNDKEKGINPRDVLTEQELSIARLVVAGLSSKEIGNELDLTARSVDKHRANIMEKLGVRQVAGVVRLCVLHGIH
jgi:DNA-binding NarL/FixJ family response regulator